MFRDIEQMVREQQRMNTNQSRGGANARQRNGGFRKVYVNPQAFNQGFSGFDIFEDIIKQAEQQAQSGQRRTADRKKHESTHDARGKRPVSVSTSTSTTIDPFTRQKRTVTVTRTTYNDGSVNEEVAERGGESYREAINPFTSASSQRRRSQRSQTEQRQQEESYEDLRKTQQQFAKQFQKDISAGVRAILWSAITSSIRQWFASMRQRVRAFFRRFL